MGFISLAYPNNAARLLPGMVAPFAVVSLPLSRLPLGLSRLPLGTSPNGAFRAPGAHAKQGNKCSLFRNTGTKVYEFYTNVFTIAKQIPLKFTDTKPNLTYFAFQNAQTFPCYRNLFLCMLVCGVGVPSI